jgi:hypothetical protein
MRGDGLWDRYVVSAHARPPLTQRAAAARRCSVSAKGVPARCKGRCSCRRSRIRSTGTRIRSTGTRTPTTWPRRAEALASAASARVCVTRSLAASWRGAPRSAARRRRWSSGSLAVARASRVRSGRVHPLQGPIALSPFAGVSARRFETCARRCAEPRRDERGQPSRPAMAPRGCRRRYSSSPVVSRPSLRRLSEEMPALPAMRPARLPAAIRPASSVLAESPPLGSRDLMPLVDTSSESLTVSRSRCSWLFLLTSRSVASVHAVVRDAFSIASTSSVLVMVVHSSIPTLAASSTSSGLS